MRTSFAKQMLVRIAARSWLMYEMKRRSVPTAVSRFSALEHPMSLGPIEQYLFSASVVLASVAYCLVSQQRPMFHHSSQDNRHTNPCLFSNLIYQTEHIHPFWIPPLQTLNIRKIPFLEGNYDLLLPPEIRLAPKH